MEQRHFISHLHQRFVVTVAMQQDASAGQRGWSVFPRVPDQKLAEQQRLLSQPPGARIGREKILQLIAEDAGAARLQKDKRHSGINLPGEEAQGVFQISAGLAKKSEVVQRPPAADMPFRGGNRESGILKYLAGGSKHLWMVVIVTG